MDIGCQIPNLHKKLNQKYKITLADLNPRHKTIKKQDIRNLSFKDNSFDIVLCQQVLEHIDEPVKAILELKRVYKNQLIISVPNEPFFTILRLFSWEKEHLWAITPRLLKKYLGEPVFEKTIFFKRYYIAVWERK